MMWKTLFVIFLSVSGQLDFASPNLRSQKGLSDAMSEDLRAHKKLLLPVKDMVSLFKVQF